MGRALVAAPQCGLSVVVAAFVCRWSSQNMESKEGDTRVHCCDLCVTEHEYLSL